MLHPDRPRWTHPQALRLWRAVHSNVLHDEPLQAADAYTDESLAAIAAHGFTAIWIFARLYDLMHSTVWPQLNSPASSRRIASLQTVIDRARRHGLGVFLYFNEPAGLACDHPFWQTHPDLKGPTRWGRFALCMSDPRTHAFFEDAVASVFHQLHAAGVLLITAGEDLTDCWSKVNRVGGDAPPACPRCAQCEPADPVLAQLRLWSRVSSQQPQPFRILAWNWEWSMWYDDPQAPLVSQLPAHVELLADMEIGGHKPWRDRTAYVGEYSLSYAGPSRRLVAAARLAAQQGTPVHAKIELNNTHELCSVPNLPLVPNLHAKFAAMTQLDLAGCMAVWTMGSRFTLNSAAMQLYLQNPPRYADARAFMADLARTHLGVADPRAIEQLITAWQGFTAAFALYPLTVRLVYTGPHNDAPARPLSLHFRGEKLGPSYRPCPMGDDLSACMAPTNLDRASFTLDQIVAAFADMADRWAAAMPAYESVLQNPEASAHPQQRLHQQQELSCARMIACQLRSLAHVFQFHQRRAQLLDQLQLTPPCTLPADDLLVQLMRAELANAQQALPLVDADPRLGFHQDFQGYKYDPATIRAKINAMRSELDQLAHPAGRC